MGPAGCILTLTSGMLLTSIIIFPGPVQSREKRPLPVGPHGGVRYRNYGRTAPEDDVDDDCDSSDDKPPFENPVRTRIPSMYGRLKVKTFTTKTNAATPKPTSTRKPNVDKTTEKVEYTSEKTTTPKGHTTGKSTTKETDSIEMTTTDQTEDASGEFTSKPGFTESPVSTTAGSQPGKGKPPLVQDTGVVSEETEKPGDIIDSVEKLSLRTTFGPSAVSEEIKKSGDIRNRTRDLSFPPWYKPDWLKKVHPPSDVLSEEEEVTGGNTHRKDIVQDHDHLPHPTTKKHRKRTTMLPPSEADNDEGVVSGETKKSADVPNRTRDLSLPPWYEPDWLKEAHLPSDVLSEQDEDTGGKAHHKDIVQDYDHLPHPTTKKPRKRATMLPPATTKKQRKITTTLPPATTKKQKKITTTLPPATTKKQRKIATTLPPATTKKQKKITTTLPPSEADNDEGAVCEENNKPGKILESKENATLPPPFQPNEWKPLPFGFEEETHGPLAIAGNNQSSNNTINERTLKRKKYMGRVTTTHEYPYQVVLEFTPMDAQQHPFRCLGALLDGYHVLTAGICVDMKIRSGLVYAGVNDLSKLNTSDTQIRETAIIHRVYRPETSEAGIALVRVYLPFVINYVNVSPLPVADNEAVVDGVRCQLVGFASNEAAFQVQATTDSDQLKLRAQDDTEVIRHLMNPRDRRAARRKGGGRTINKQGKTQLRRTDVKLESDDACRHAISTHQRPLTVVCANKRPCGGVIGSSLVCAGHYVGMAVGGTEWGCLTLNKPGTFIRVGVYKSWIQWKIDLMNENGVAGTKKSVD